jgi:hypothetical protein
VKILQREGKRLLGRLRHRWEDNIRKDQNEIGINMTNWFGSAKDRIYWRALVQVNALPHSSIF